MPWTDPDLNDWAVGQAVTASDMDTYVKDNLSWLGVDRPHGRVTDASFSHNSTNNWLSPSWSTISTNVGTGFATSTGYFTAPNAGFSLLGADATFASNTTGARAIMLSSGADGTGTVYAQNFSPSQSLAIASAVTTGVQLAANAQVYVSLFQASGGTLTVTNIHMWAMWETV